MGRGYSVVCSTIPSRRRPRQSLWGGIHATQQQWRPRPHADLRHSGGTMAAQTGATLAELMGRLGHSSPQAAMRYQHVAKSRDEQIAQELSRRAGEPITGVETTDSTEK